jgi:hypothetical protein
VDKKDDELNAVGHQVFAAYGRAMSLVQGVEADLLGLTLVVGAHGPIGIEASDFQDLEVRLSKKTFGGLLRNLEDAGYITRDTYRRWFDSLDRRNRLAHGFFVGNVERFLTVGTLREVLAELNAAAVEFDQVRDQVRYVTDLVLKTVNVDMDEFRKRVDQELRSIYRAGGADSPA